MTLPWPATSYAVRCKTCREEMRGVKDYRVRHTCKKCGGESRERKLKIVHKEPQHEKA